MKFKPFSNKCPICGGNLKYLSIEHRTQWRYQWGISPFKECTICNAVLRAKPTPLFWLITAINILLLAIFSSFSEELFWGYFLFGTLFEIIYYTAFSPYMPHNGYIFTDLEYERQMWQKESGEWMRKQREQNKDD